MPRGIPNAKPEGPFASDTDLGIGEELTAEEQASAQAGALAALLASPAAQQLIDAAVASRLAQMGAPSGEAAPASSEAFRAFTDTLKHLINAQALQQPGYIKPLPADELDRRLAGKIEMEALLLDYKDKGTPPEWSVGEGGFFECTNALEFREGDLIRTYLPPAEDFTPRNVQADRVQEASMRWLGGPTRSIGEQVEAAMRDANRPAFVSSDLLENQRPQSVELVQREEAPARKRRTAGTIVPERQDVSLAERAAGPTYV